MAKPRMGKIKGSVRIMLVADNASSLHIISKVLNKQPKLVVVGSVQGCKLALEQANSLQPRIILIDFDGPGNGGLETIACIRAALPSVSIIALSLLDSPTSLQEAIDAGADEIVNKLSMNTDLLPACQRAVHP